MAGEDVGTGLAAYGRLLRHRPAAAPFWAAMVARLPMSMAPLGILLLVQHARGAYGVAGLVTGAFALGSAVGTPLWGRLMDRHGQVGVLLPTSLGSAAFLVVVTIATVLGFPTVVLAGLAAGAGLAYPPIGPALRAAWRVIFPDPAARRVAFALDATSVELIFVGGPLLLSLLLALFNPVVPLLVTAGLMACGGLAYCRTSAARRSRPTSAGEPHTRRGSATTSTQPVRGTVLAMPGVGSVLLTMLALSVAFGQLDTSMAATAGQLLGGTENVGVLFAAIAGGSTVGGLAFGARHWPFEERRAVAVLLGLFGLLLAVMALLMGAGLVRLRLVLPLLFLTGLTIAPTLIMQQSQLDLGTPRHRLNEAQSLLSAANTTGAAAGTALAGLIIDHRGLGWSFGGAALFAGVACLVALLRARRPVGRGAILAPIQTDGRQPAEVPATTAMSPLSNLSDKQHYVR